MKRKCESVIVFLRYYQRCILCTQPTSEFSSCDFWPSLQRIWGHEVRNWHSTWWTEEWKITTKKVNQGNEHFFYTGWCLGTDIFYLFITQAVRMFETSSHTQKFTHMFPFWYLAFKIVEKKISSKFRYLENMSYF